VDKEIYFIDRKTQERRKEKIYCESALRFLYGSPLGRVINEGLSKSPLFSKLFGWWQRCPHTKRKIAPFVSEYGINAAECEYPLEDYPSFDAFFSRRLKKEARPLGSGVVCPADGRYLFYQNIADCDGFIVKGKKFSLEKLLANPTLASQYTDGSMALVRLAPSDYHRFHFPQDCLPGPAMLINGPLYSVNPLAVRQNIDLHIENKRMVTQLKTPQQGTILIIEIGATSVGSIHQTYTPNQPYKKGDEKGYFSFGGSSISLLFEANRIQFAPDLISNSMHHTETLCLFGQSLEKDKEVGL
jgi:phosphatidylserine decarboxylase